MTFQAEALARYFDRLLKDQTRLGSTNRRDAVVDNAMVLFRYAFVPSSLFGRQHLSGHAKYCDTCVRLAPVACGVLLAGALPLPIPTASGLVT